MNADDALMIREATAAYVIEAVRIEREIARIQSEPVDATTNERLERLLRDLKNVEPLQQALCAYYTLVAPHRN